MLQFTESTGQVTESISITISMSNVDENENDDNEDDHKKCCMSCVKESTRIHIFEGKGKGRRKRKYDDNVHLQ
jgi:hypothetical protein